jgi:hypothetical protein
VVATLLPPDLAAVTLRPASVTDALAFAALATQLGYPSSPREVEERLTTVLEDSNHLSLAAMSGGHVVGWAHAYVCCLVESSPWFGGR